MQAFTITNTKTGAAWTVIGSNSVGARKTIAVAFGQAMDALTAEETELDMLALAGLL